VLHNVKNYFCIITAHHPRRPEFSLLLSIPLGQDSVISIVICYGLDGPGIKSWWGTRLSTAIQTGPGAHTASYTMCTRSFFGVKLLGRGVDHPPPCSNEVKE